MKKAVELVAFSARIIIKCISTSKYNNQHDLYNAVTPFCFKCTFSLLHSLDERVRIEGSSDTVYRHHQRATFHSSCFRVSV